MTALLAAFLAAGALAAPAPADKDTLAMVEAFIKAPTASLPPEHIDRFLAVDAESLPKKIQTQFRAKVEELRALKKIADGKRKAPLRRLGNDSQAQCEAPREPGVLPFMKQMGFVEIDETEEEKLEREVNCTMCEMQVEFSLVVVKQKKQSKNPKEPPRFHYLYHSNDPVWVLIQTYRDGKKPGGTNFFGINMTPKCR